MKEDRTSFSGVVHELFPGVEFLREAEHCVVGERPSGDSFVVDGRGSSTDDDGSENLEGVHVDGVMECPERRCGWWLTPVGDLIEEVVDVCGGAV